MRLLCAAAREFDGEVGASAKLQELFRRLQARWEAMAWTSALSTRISKLWLASGLVERIEQFQASVDARCASEGIA